MADLLQCQSRRGSAYGEYKDNLRRTAENFRITDDHLGEGGPKAKFQANIAAIKLLKYLEETTEQATPEQQEILSRYVGWGGLADAFDLEKPAWAAEYTQLKELLTPEEYAAARGSTLNAHYTSPTVIRAIYEAVGVWDLRPATSWSVLWCRQFLRYAAGEYGRKQAVRRGAGQHFRAHCQQLYQKTTLRFRALRKPTCRYSFFDVAIGTYPLGSSRYWIRSTINTTSLFMIISLPAPWIRCAPAAWWLHHQQRHHG